MVTMSSSFTLPPVIQRFGRCGEWEQRMPSESPSPEVGDQSSVVSKAGGDSKQPAGYRADRVKSIVDGIISPFTACWTPTDPCGPVQCSDKVFRKQPSVVSPHLDRIITYRDSRDKKDRPVEDYYAQAQSRRYPHPHQHRDYHQHRYPKPTSAQFSSSRREPAEESATSTTTTEKKKRTTDIAKPRSNDILCGRGGSSNRHLGNIHFRELVAANKQIYVGLTKKQKMLVARKIVDAIHTTGGRFLAKDLDTGMFYDIGLPRSLEKTSQALREKHSNEMPVQQVTEEEGVEASEESHNAVIKKTEESKAGAGEPSAEAPSSSKSSSNKSSKSNNNSTEAPDLIIPSHLMSKFGPKGSSAQDEDHEGNQTHSLSPRSYHSDPSYEGHRSPYPPSPYGHPPAHSPPVHHPHHHPRYPPSPSNQYPHPPPHYYHYPPGHPPQTPQFARRPDERYPYPDREAYERDYYQRAGPHAPYHRYPRPGAHHRGHPVPHVSPSHAPSRGTPPPPRPGYGPQQSPPSHASGPPLIPQYRPSPHSRYYRYDDKGSPTMPRRDGQSSTSPSSRIIYRNSNSGYVRGNSEVSPERQREMKRQRNEDGESVTTASPQRSDVSLSSAVKNSLSLDDRVVGKERKQQQQESGSSGSLNLVSPSTMLQTKSFSRGASAVNDRGSPTEKKEQDYSALSGLAALSTAAFLKLDEDDDMK